MAAPPPPPAPVRLRLVFDNRRLLRRAERNEGLRRCWLLLRPELVTIADLAAHVVVRFRLRRSCPRGVVLSMDGFALPPFEPTCIFRDKDIVRVKQKSCKTMIGHNDTQCIRVPDIVEKMPLPIDGEVLSIEYRDDGSKNQEKEKQSDDRPGENATVKNNGTSTKRKWYDGVPGLPESSKKTKLKVTNSRKDIDCSKENSDNQHQDHQSGLKMLMLSPIDIKAKKAMLQSETTATSMEQQKLERNHQTELTCEAKAADFNAQSNTKKLESRSARRKKLKRQLRRETKEKMEKNVHENPPIDADYPSSSNQNGFPGPSSNKNGSHVPLSSRDADEEESDTSDEIVPVVVRPGHIRFEPAGGEPDKAPAKEIQSTFQWNGTTSKKKGQKWGMNNSNKKNTGIVSHHVMGSKTTEDHFCRISNENIDEGSKMESSRVKTVADEEKCSGEALDFESLYPLTRLPKEGDLIAYRLIELSSSLCPELSSYRVGKVLVYDRISLRIILLPVPEYPIISEEKKEKPEDESNMLVDFSPYKEDGSLEIEYSSLLDVRLLKSNESVPAAISTPIAETGKNGGSVTGNAVTLDRNKSNVDSQEPHIFPNDTKTPEATPGKTENTVWEENGEPPNDKPDVQENGWGTWTRNASTSAWSYRALRSSALGPTMAILRGKNSQQGKPYNQKYGK